MNSEEVLNKLKQIKIEDGIWMIYIGIIFLSWQANYFEKNYYVNRDLKSKQKYQVIMRFIFSILIIVYYYFLKSSYEDVKKLKKSDSQKKKLLVYASYLGSLFIFISGIIFLFIAFTDENLDTELAFN